jgi:hypothetical protein
MIENTKTYDLVDIRDVQVDRNQPQTERIIDYVRQIKNPYHFKCGERAVKAYYAENGISFEECLRRLMV